MNTETITPKLAAKLYASSIGNRPISKDRVDRYANDMRAGQWMFTGEPVIFSPDGELLNGHHRLLACAKAGVPFKTAVVRGVDRKAFAVIDSGKSRNVPDVLSIGGLKNVTALASVLRGIDVLNLGENKANKGWTSTRALEVHKAYPRAEHWASVYKASAASRLFTSWLASVYTLGERTQGAALVAEFARLCADGEGLTKSHPVWHLRQKFLSRARGTQISQGAAMTFYVVTWNYFVEGRSVGLLRAPENMPEVA